MARTAAPSNTFGKCTGHLSAYGSMLANELLWDISKLGLQWIGINNRAAEEIARAAGNSSDTFCDCPAGARFRDGQCCAAKLQEIADNLLERFALAGINVIVQRVFQLLGQFGHAVLSFLERTGARTQVHLDIAG